MEIYGETLGDSQVEVRFLVLVTQIHHFLTWKPRFDPTLHTICLYLFIREVIENMPFSILASLVQAWKQEKTTICCYGCIIESQTSATTTTFRELCSKEMTLSETVNRKKTKTSWKTFKVKSFPLRSAAIFRIFESRNNNKQFVEQIDLSSGSSHSYHHILTCSMFRTDAENSEREGLLWVNRNILVYMIYNIYNPIRFKPSYKPSLMQPIPPIQ